MARARKPTRRTTPSGLQNQTFRKGDPGLAQALKAAQAARKPVYLTAEADGLRGRRGGRHSGSVTLDGKGRGIDPDYFLYTRGAGRLTQWQKMELFLEQAFGDVTGDMGESAYGNGFDGSSKLTAVTLSW